jgi:hypothetical protein
MEIDMSAQMGKFEIIRTELPEDVTEYNSFVVTLVTTDDGGDDVYVAGTWECGGDPLMAASVEIGNMVRKIGTTAVVGTVTLFNAMED